MMIFFALCSKRKTTIFVLIIILFVIFCICALSIHYMLLTFNIENILKIDAILNISIFWITIICLIIFYKLNKQIVVNNNLTTPLLV